VQKRLAFNNVFDFQGLDCPILELLSNVFNANTCDAASDYISAESSRFTSTETKLKMIAMVAEARRNLSTSALSRFSLRRQRTRVIILTGRESRQGYLQREAML
jgi:hypothetical protein